MNRNKPNTAKVVFHLTELVNYLSLPMTTNHAALVALHELLRPNAAPRNFKKILDAFEADRGTEFTQELKANRPEAWLIEGCLRLLAAESKEVA